MQNTSDLVHKLEKLGFSKEQAEGSVKIGMEIMDGKFATKDDLEKLSTKLHNDMERLSLILHNDAEKLAMKVQNDVDKLSDKIETGFEKQSRELTIKLGGMIVAAIGIFSAINKY